MERNKPAHWTRNAGILLLFVAALACLAIPLKLRINPSHSLQPGLYRVWPDAVMARGAIMRFCPPSSEAMSLLLTRRYVSEGDCPGGYPMLMKKIAALPGDVIDIDDQGVRVNGQQWVNSKPLLVDKAGRPMPHLRLHQYQLGQREMLMMSDYSARSFDGRYFGPIELPLVREIVRPFWLW